MIFNALNSSHNRENFDCGNEELNLFLRTQASQNARRHIGVTHVLTTNAEPEKILAYYTLVNKVISGKNIPDKGLPKNDIGVVLLARLAVDLNAQSKGYGRICLIRAIKQIRAASKEIGIYAMVVDAKNEKVLSWYTSSGFGFLTLLDNRLHIYLPTKTIQALNIP